MTTHECIRVAPWVPMTPHHPKSLNAYLTVNYALKWGRIFFVSHQKYTIIIYMIHYFTNPWYFECFCWQLYWVSQKKYDEQIINILRMVKYNNAIFRNIVATSFIYLIVCEVWTLYVKFKLWMWEWWVKWDLENMWFILSKWDASV